MQSGADVDRDRDRRVARVILIEGAANAAIAVLKAVVGFATGSLAILGDAVHSLTDLANNIVAWFVIRWSAAPPDDGHPYGHRKFETVAVFLLAMLLSLTAFELALAALRRAEPEILDAPWAAAGMLGVLATNVGLASWENFQARRLESDLLRADARHTFADVLTTIVAIGGWQAAARGYVWLDTLAALGVALLIGFLAYGLFRRSLPVLVDQASIDADHLRRAALAVPGVVAVRQVRSRSYGRLAAVDLVVGVAPDLSTLVSHEIATRVERALHAAFPLESVTVHVEPAARVETEPHAARPLRAAREEEA
jgi:cation diffusion facilitator family transporter